MQARIGLLLAAVALAAGCASAATAPLPSPAVPAAPPPASSTAHRVPHRVSPDANVVACRAMEAYPPFHTTQQARRYITFLGRRVVFATGTSSRLADAAQVLRADLSAYLLGASSAAQLLRDARHLQAVCTGYGVRGPTG